LTPFGEYYIEIHYYFNNCKTIEKLNIIRNPNYVEGRANVITGRIR
jgi:hypothetical protein